MPTSSVRLNVGESNIEATLAIPASDLEAASGVALGNASTSAVDASADALRTYLLAHLAPQTTDGIPWTVVVQGLTVRTAGDRSTTGIYQEVVADVLMTPPTGGDLHHFDLGYDGVVHAVANHVVVVTVTSDWANGTVGESREVGVVRRDTVTNTVTPLTVDLGAGSTWRGLRSMVGLGIQHISEGTDHQLFLLCLLLPAPVLATRRRWSTAKGVGATLRSIVATTSAFTLGHSLTLALGALGVTAPAAIVEPLIAVSILVAAIHAIRPLFPGREAAVAAGFGLVHGLAFSATLQELDLSGTQLVLSLLGFNLGIELMQLLVVALVVPPLVVLARTRAHSRLRTAAALVVAVAALGWLADRLGLPNLIATLADQSHVAALPMLTTLWLGAVLVMVRRHQSAPAPA
ncbi:HupE/UreJ family protein [Arthrobacter sp. NEB 688]|uniref:HupE/UreJ family protein n=1 Tax=Arthrobacter sp. NEB 688 TaxID=904039 RepID=UPI00156538DA|nr:HupE/UreJ family protein [Arthrobacter sp. NEB 688]QKE85155.1 HupE/UreJ family protein [Arthrobacter sp. NEB 688]